MFCCGDPPLQMVVLYIGNKLVKISYIEKCFGCGSHLDKGRKVSFSKRLLLGTCIFY